VIGDVLAFDEAVGVALDFAKKNKQTLVLSFTDHGNGGMSIGNAATSASYSKMPYDALIPPLFKANLTGEGVEMLLLQLGADGLTDGEIIDAMGYAFGISDLTVEEFGMVRLYMDVKLGVVPPDPSLMLPGDLNYIVGPMISERSAIGWTTNGHTGEDVTLFAWPTYRAFGTIENTELAELCAIGMDVDLALADRLLYVDAIPAFEALGATAVIETASVVVPAPTPANPAATKTVTFPALLRVTKGEVVAVMPFAKDVLEIAIAGVPRRPVLLAGITVYAPKNGKVWVPAQAAQAVKVFSAAAY
jgi:alkaline phosphatase